MAYFDVQHKNYAEKIESSSNLFKNLSEQLLF